MSIEYSTKKPRDSNYCTWLYSLISVIGFKARRALGARARYRARARDYQNIPKSSTP
jgi:hypothetical protein